MKTVIVLLVHSVGASENRVTESNATPEDDNEQET